MSEAQHICKCGSEMKAIALSSHQTPIRYCHYCGRVYVTDIDAFLGHKGLHGALRTDGNDPDGNDYVLQDGYTSAWVLVGNISVYIYRTDEGVVVDLYPHHGEADEPLASTYAFSAKAQEEIDERNSEEIEHA